MSNSLVCLKCNNTGIDSDFNICDCGALYLRRKEKTSLPLSPYTGIEFNVDLLPDNVTPSYKEGLTYILDGAKKGRVPSYNTLVISPISTGKTIFATTLLETLSSHCESVSSIFDILDIKDAMYNTGGNFDLKEALAKDKFMVIRIPLLLPFGTPELMYTILQRRTGLNNYTMFLFSGSIEDLKKQKEQVIQRLVQDGSFCTVKLIC